MAKKQYLDKTGLDILVAEIKSLLSGKASSSHSHSISDVNGLQNSLNSMEEDIGKKSSVQIVVWGADD